MHEGVDFFERMEANRRSGRIRAFPRSALASAREARPSARWAYQTLIAAVAAVAADSRRFQSAINAPHPRTLGHDDGGSVVPSKRVPLFCSLAGEATPSVLLSDLDGRGSLN